MPIMRMIAPSVCWSVGTTWLRRLFSPVAASTAENASSTGQPGRDERAERDDEDRERERQRGELRAAHVVREALVELVVGRRLAELLDDHAGVPACASSIAFRIGAILSCGVLGLALDVELHERGVAVGRDEPGARMLDRRDDVRRRPAAARASG